MPISKGRATRCSAARRSWPAIASAAISAGTRKSAELLGCEVIPLELVDPRYYHLDTCFCPLAPGVAIYYPPAFDSLRPAALRAHIDDLIPVDDDEAGSLPATPWCWATTVITNSGCPELHGQLRERGFATEEWPLGEFVKAGGSAKCLTLRLDGEEAAAWKLATASTSDEPKKTPNDY